jgi:phage major head subunit gpT-like protein
MRYITAAGIRGEFFLAVEALRSQWLDPLCVRFPSNSASESYAWLGTPSGLTEVGGEKHGEELPEYTLTIRNKTFDGGIEFRREDIERDKTGQISLTRTREFAARCANHDVELVSALMLAGTGTTLGKAYDGQNFFSASHSSAKSGTQKNLLTKTTITELQVAVAAKPTSTEAVNAILGVIAHMLGYKDDQGKPMNSTARQFMVMTAPALWSRLVPAVVNATINSGDTNTIASLRQDGFDISIVANPLLTYTVDFDVYRTDAPLKPYAIQEEVPLEFDVLDENSEHFKLNNSIVGKAYTRKNVGFARWEYAAHATLST